MVLGEVVGVVVGDVKRPSTRVLSRYPSTIMFSVVATLAHVVASPKMLPENAATSKPVARTWHDDVNRQRITTC